MSNDLVVLTCAICDRPISTPLGRLPDTDHLRPEDGKQLLPAGAYVVARDLAGVFESSHISPDELFLSLADLLSVRPGGVRNGCCGVDGLDGPNLFCPNGHPVGTEVSDCWTPHYVHCERALVRLVPSSAT